MSTKKDFVIYFFLGFFLVGIIFTLVSLSLGRTNFFGKALIPGSISPEACRVFASPVVSKSGGSDRIRVTVFVLDDTGKGVPSKEVSLLCRDNSLCQTSQVVFSPIQVNTDNLGQAFYDVSAMSAGSFEVVASVEGVSIPQTVTVVFR